VSIRTPGNWYRPRERRTDVNRSHPLLLLALPLVATAALAACGSDADGSATSDSPTDQTSDSQTETSVPTSGSDGLDGRSFVSTEVDGHELVPDSVVRLTFEDGSLSINAGCNTMFGGYTVEGDVLSAPTMAMTEMACDPALMEQDAWISGLISNGPTVTVDGDTLTIAGPDAQTITFLDTEVAEPDQPLEGTRWVVDGLLANEGVSTVPIGAEASITISDGTAAVEAGCNTGSATVTITDSTITFGPLMLTRMACPQPQMDLENAVVSVLSGDVAYTIDSSTLQLRTSTDAGEIGLNLTAA
jgi:heat shock protein HslJ